MKTRRTEWERLVAAARLAPADSLSAPQGFSSRVSALAVEQRQPGDWSTLFGQFSWRALSASAAVAAAVVFLNFKPVVSNLDDVAASFAEAPVEAEDIAR